VSGILYIVATPLGNLEDITQRALRVLREVSLIAAEDTRHSRKLLSHFGISTPLVSYHDRVEQSRAPRLIERLKRGERVALISDAGTPIIADPGYRLVRGAIAAGIQVVPVPGPSAVIAALSASGLPSDRFVFEGFVPARAAARRGFYARFDREERTVVCFETARRLPASLADLADVLGDREVVVARELTKKFEEIVRGKISEVRSRLAAEELRGEVTLILGPATHVEPETSDENVEEEILRLHEKGLGLKEIARSVATATSRSRNDVYRLALRVLRRKS
jgi:16S rRNA (cytidine1402-2'-O)-methyltransferase